MNAQYDEDERMGFLLSHLEHAATELEGAAAWAHDMGESVIGNDCDAAAEMAHRSMKQVRGEKG